jgi:hypothetical protein
MARKGSKKKERPRVVASCGHLEYNDGHCAVMICPNYISKHMH